MSSILYYSSFCPNSNNIIKSLSKSSVKDDIHFVSIDKRIKENGAVYAVLENGQKLLLPPSVNKVPALLLLNRGHKVLFGDEILQHLQPQHNEFQEKAVDYNGEPSAYTLGSGFGVVSDNYSFLDQNPDELSAKGQGGMRQTHHYATLNHEDAIETPPDTYNPDKIGNVSMENLQNQRNSEIKN